MACECKLYLSITSNDRPTIWAGLSDPIKLLLTAFCLSPSILCKINEIEIETIYSHDGIFLWCLSFSIAEETAKCFSRFQTFPYRLTRSLCF